MVEQITIPNVPKQQVAVVEAQLTHAGATQVSSASNADGRYVVTAIRVKKRSGDRARQSRLIDQHCC